MLTDLIKPGNQPNVGYHDFAMSVLALIEIYGKQNLEIKNPVQDAIKQDGLTKRSRHTLLLACSKEIIYIDDFIVTGKCLILVNCVKIKNSR